jgi:enediyne biosynthesis protein E4
VRKITKFNQKSMFFTRYSLFIPVFLMLLLSNCTDNKDTLFTKLEKGKTGIDFRNLLQESPEMNVLNYIYFYNGAGVAVGDINNDGLQDLFFAGNMVKNRLYLNKGNFEFDDITKKSSVAAQEGWCTGATMVDINADGWLDIYICRSADIRPEARRNLLFINNKDLTFTERAAEYGLADSGYSTHSAFFDMDRDGDLDLFLLNHSLSQYAGVKQEMAQLKKQQNPDYASKLYRNDQGKYKDVTDSVGITNNVLSFGLGCGISDVNGDNWPDIYVCNDFNEQDYLFVNNQNGTFTERLPAFFDHTSLYSMGCDWSDLNNDGLPELMTVDMLPESNHDQKMHAGAENYNKFQNLFSNGFYYQYSRNMLHKNNGNGTFSEIGQLAGTSNTDWSWAVLGADFDLDGNKDLFVTNGYVKDYTEMDFLKYTMDKAQTNTGGMKKMSPAELLESMKGSQISNYFFQNQGDMTFKNIASSCGLDHKGWSYGAAYSDLDNDGDLDLITNDINEPAGIYRNNTESKNTGNWLKIKLLQEKPNQFAIGTKVRIEVGDKIFYQEMMPSRGYASSVDYNLVFGLGQANQADKITLTWPDGTQQTLQNVATKQTLTIEKKSTTPVAIAATKASIFTQKNEAIDFKYLENQNVIDFKNQALLPNFLSRQGPCMAKGDINGDGLEDLFFGGAKGQSGQLFLGKKEGNFSPKLAPFLAAAKNSEDTGATFFDADGDKDLDLYVVSGGYEFEANDPALQDRLYFNDGKGNFSIKPNTIPMETISGACAKPADIDGDGDMDLFIGGRLMPNRWPEVPESQLLINDGKGIFTNQTNAIAPSLSEVGMVTDAVWADLNGDKLPELLVVGEWMPLRIFDNKSGKLEESTTQRIAEKTSGWWNCITADDFDGDGDTDFILGNHGLNSQLKAAANEPMTLDFMDFDQNGTIDPLMGYYLGGKNYPAAFRDDLFDQLPSLKKKYNDYKSYSDATIADFYSKEILEKAQHLEIQELRSVYLENNQGKFTIKALPMEAQYSPIYAAVSLDANGDGKKDLLLAGNNAYTRIRYGRYNACQGALFLGDGKGGFTYQNQLQSGLKIRGDVRSAVVLMEQKTVIFGINDAAAEVWKW